MVSLRMSFMIRSSSKFLMIRRMPLVRYSQKFHSVKAAPPRSVKFSKVNPNLNIGGTYYEMFGVDIGTISQQYDLS